MMSDYDFQCVVVTHDGKSAPFLVELEESNPGLKIEVWNSPGASGAPPDCDRNFREWFKNAKVSEPRIMFLDNDVKVTGDLRLLFPRNGNGLEGATLTSDIEENRLFGLYPMLDWVPEAMRHTACILSPAAVYMFSIEALAVLSSDEFDPLFEKQMLCEFRTPTLLAYKGFKIAGNPLLTHVKCYESRLPLDGNPGIIHPVKTRRFSLDALPARLLDQPPGYLADITAAGSVVGGILEIDTESLREIRRKYREPQPIPTPASDCSTCGKH